MYLFSLSSKVSKTCMSLRFRLILNRVKRKHTVFFVFCSNAVFLTLLYCCCCCYCCCCVSSTLDLSTAAVVILTEPDFPFLSVPDHLLPKAQRCGSSPWLEGPESEGHCLQLLPCLDRCSFSPPMSNFSPFCNAGCVLTQLLWKAIFPRNVVKGDFRGKRIVAYHALCNRRRLLHKV